MAVAIDKADNDDGHEAIEHVELRRLDSLTGDHGNTHAHLHEDAQFNNDNEPPQRAGSQRLDPVRSERPRAGKGVADDDKPRKGLMNASEHWEILALLRRVDRNDRLVGPDLGTNAHGAFTAATAGMAAGMAAGMTTRVSTSGRCAFGTAVPIGECR